MSSALLYLPSDQTEMKNIIKNFFMHIYTTKLSLCLMKHFNQTLSFKGGLIQLAVAVKYPGIILEM